MLLMYLSFCDGTIAQQKQSIAFVCSQFNPGGAEFTASQLLNLLQSSFSIYLIVNENETIWFKIPNTTVLRLNSSNISAQLLSFQSTFNIQRFVFVESWNISILQSSMHLQKDQVYFLSVLPLLTVFQSSANQTNENQIFKQQLLTFKNSKLICTTKQDAALWSQFNINTVYIPTPHYIQQKRISQNDLEPNVIVIGTMDQFQRRTNLAVDSFFKIQQQISNAKLFLVGSGANGMKSALLELSKIYKMERNVKILDFYENIEIFYEQGAVLLSCGEYGQMKTRQQAKEYGMPVVSYKKPAQFSQEGEIIVDNEDQMAEETIKLLTDFEYRRKTVENGYKAVEDTTNELITENWIQILNGQEIEQTLPKVTKKELMERIKEVDLDIFTLFEFMEEE
ncbi:Glycosyl_transferases group 1 family protein [Hexamita inflata]|uniref:Glycosyl transferases group 1 family protein n=1 Tax=Hexamita inflata TaxID=28002 RepID=A0AA86QRM1_9EUKA|nr:Glycosyl transferases group 1 family protein [Hexamita inflata]